MRRNRRGRLVITLFFVAVLLISLGSGAAVTYAAFTDSGSVDVSFDVADNISATDDTDSDEPVNETDVNDVDIDENVISQREAVGSGPFMITNKMLH